jgi:peptidoglycan/xylan/chitin deacetylase (PgdA/CDA1 family)
MKPKSASWLERMPLALLSPAGSRARLAIFTYHRVLAVADPLMPDDPDARIFGEQMQWLTRYFRILPLEEAAAKLHEGKLPERTACVTFDDGYANNYELARPILKSLGMTATVFVATDAVERGIMWNDLVIEAVRRAGPVLRGSDLAAIGMPHRDLPSQSGSIERVLEHLKYQALEARWQLAATFFARVAATEPPRLMMSASTLREMARDGIAIGAHTVHHPILKTQSAEEARREIIASRDWIAAAVGVVPVAFAYPNGRPGRDYDASHVEMVRDAGFRLAVSTAWGCATRASNLLELPRVAFWDRTRARFWLRALRTYAGSYYGRE